MPLKELIANPPSSCTGQHRVAVWVSPEMTPATVARLLVWHTRYHVALGFTCELAYLYQKQLDAVIADPDIMHLVQQSQLWLVLVEDFFPEFTWNSTGREHGVERNFVENTDRGIAVNYTDQMVVNVHSVLASTGQDTWLLSVDLDEYLAVSHPSEVQDLFAQCLNGTSALIQQFPATCPNCSTAGSDLPFWMEVSGQHPLASYVERYPIVDGIKSLLRPDDVISFGVHMATLRQGQQLGPDVAAGCGILLLHLEDMYIQRYFGDREGNITDWKWVFDRL